MGQTSTQTMVATMQGRLPLGLTAQFCMDRLNEAFQYCNQKGPMVWNLVTSTITITGATGPMPTNFDAGKPAFILSSVWNQEITYQPAELAFNQSDTQGITNIQPGQFSFWTFIQSGTIGAQPTYTAYFYPTQAAYGAPTAQTIVFHQKWIGPLTVGPAVYFPTPDDWDPVLVELATAYAMSPAYLRMWGWEALQKKAENSISLAVDQFRSTKRLMAGLADQAREAQERQLNAAS